MIRPRLTLAAAALTALPLAAFAATRPVPGPLSYAAEYAAYDRAAASDLRHAAANLAPRHAMPDGPARPGTALHPVALRPAAARVAAAENWMERAETELLNRASFRADGRLTAGQPIVADAATQDVMDARADLLKGDLRGARKMDRTSIHELRMELPRG